MQKTVIRKKREKDRRKNRKGARRGYSSVLQKTVIRKKEGKRQEEEQKRGAGVYSSVLPSFAKLRAGRQNTVIAKNWKWKGKGRKWRIQIAVPQGMYCGEDLWDYLPMAGKENKYPNMAFIDGQNLYLGTRERGWSVNHARLRTYLRDKYKVGEAYYFLGFVSEVEQDLYDNLQKAGFILSFREHSVALKGKKKGNVDCDIIFGLMKKLVENEPFDKAFIVSGDGDYKKIVDYLIKKNKFGKMLFPNREFASSLYKSLGSEFYAYLGDADVKRKIAHSPK